MWLSVIGGLDYWNGLLEWTTGMDFDLLSSARVESLGTALASTTLQAKPAWARGKAKQVPQCI